MPVPHRNQGPGPAGPPVSATVTMASNIPEETTSFVGRKAELARLEHTLATHRLTTLTGSGGVGKTRLAVRAARQAAAGHRDGAWWADLSPLHDDGLLIATVSDAVGLSDHTLRMPIDALCEWLVDKEMLLILDSCEHLRPACAHLLGEILTTSPGLTVLATSRQPLNIKGEQVVEVEPLPVEGAADALTLFRDRASVAAPELALDEPGNAEAAAEICRRVEGIPLAVELAAGALGRDTVQQVAARIRTCFDVPADASIWPPRHRTLRTAIGWSHELCTPLERLLWARLTVLRGDFDEAVAREVCTGGPLTPDGVTRALKGLVAKSVVGRDGVRHRMLDTIREYGRMWLAELGEERAAADRHAACFLGLARNAHMRLDRRRPDQLVPPHRRGARRPLRRPGPPAGPRHRGRPGDGRPDRLLLVLLRPSPADPRIRPARPGRRTGRGPPPHPRPVGAGHHRHAPGRLPGRPPGGPRVHQGSRARRHRRGHPRRRLSVRPHPSDDRPYSRRACARSTGSCARPAPPPRSKRPTGCAAGFITVFALTGLGRLDEAAEAAAVLRAVCVAQDECWTRSYVDYQLALIALLQGDAETSAAHARAMLAGKHRMRDRFGIALGLDILAAAIAAQGAGARAARVYGTGQVYWRMVGQPQRGTPELEPLRAACERQAREAVGDAAYQRAFERGRADNAEVGLAAALQGELLM